MQSTVTSRRHGLRFAALKWIVAVHLLPISLVSCNLLAQCPDDDRRVTLSDKTVYRVGVLAIRGKESAIKEFQTSFADYLTITAGKHFRPPLTFEMKPLNFTELFDDAEQKTVDFIFVNPSAYSCIESEYGAQSLVSKISIRKVGGREYNLTKFGGVVITRADNDNVSAVRDLRGQRVACASISGLGSGQMQFRLMQQKGLSYLNDPSQMVFTSNQEKVVTGVLKGHFDVGFVRTDQMERTKDRTGAPIDLSKLKIIEPQSGLDIDGEDFPFQSSTPLYPEWNVAALSHVHEAVAEEVQRSLLELQHHAELGSSLRACYEAANCASAEDSDRCKFECNGRYLPHETSSCSHVARTAEVSLVAEAARSQGKYTGWRSTLSYMQLRNMQEDTYFIRKDRDTGTMRCVRSSSLYDSISCPSGYERRPRREVEKGCEEAGLSCVFEGEEHQCVCSPCKKSVEVDLFPSKVKEEEGCTLGFWNGCIIGAVFGILAGCLIYRPRQAALERAMTNNPASPMSSSPR